MRQRVADRCTQAPTYGHRCQPLEGLNGTPGGGGPHTPDRHLRRGDLLVAEVAERLEQLEVAACGLLYGLLRGHAGRLARRRLHHDAAARRELQTRVERPGAAFVAGVQRDRLATASQDAADRDLVCEADLDQPL